MHDFTMQQSLSRTIVIPSEDRTQVVVVLVESDLKEIGEILEAIKKTIVKWEKVYSKGANGIAKLGGKFYIKDLEKYQDDKHLRRLFRENGINYISVRFFVSESHCWKFDEVLSQQQENLES